jgi:dihydrofolate synthase/folylpolyglutamate synthase
MRSLDEWLAHQAQAHPNPIDLGLERLGRVLRRLNWQQPSMPVVTIAGTNGKGSVAAFCTSMLAAAGYRVGTFTSPHLRDYRERICIQGAKVDSQSLLWAFEKIESAREDVSLTFFEYNAMAAMLIFECAKLDAWVMEIGMGGRLDAVNVLDPAVSVVVSIGLDHQEFLGPTLEVIAREKAGIFRRGIPAVLGSRNMPRALESVAETVGAPLKRPGAEYTFTHDAKLWHYRGPRWNLPDLPPPALMGDVQFGNAATALAALEELAPHLALPRAAVERGLTSVRLFGRFQVVPPASALHPTFILDVAHNPDAAGVLARNLAALPVVGRTFAVCGVLADKDAAGIAGQLRLSIDAWWLASTEGARGIKSAVLAARIAPEIAVPIVTCEHVGAACAAALAAADSRDRIVVLGSFHIVGPALTWLEARGMLPPEQVREYTRSASGRNV